MSAITSASVSLRSVSRSGSLSTDEASGDGASHIDALPDMTVRDYLENFVLDIEKMLMARAEENRQRVLELFEREKELLLSEAKRLKVAPNAKVRMMITLEVSLAGAAAKVVKVRAGGPKQTVAKIGRSSGAQFVEGKGVSLSGDNEVSTTHGHLAMMGDELWYEDLHSTNESTIISGGSSVKVGKESQTMGCKVKVGDMISLGKSKIKIIDISAEK